MPVKPTTFFDLDPPPAEEPSFWERLGGLSGIAGTGIRGISGAASAMGGPTGFITSGLGELGAEIIEKPGSVPSWRRILAEAVLGAVPFGAVLKAGRPLASAARGAAYGAAGAALRGRAQDQEFDPEAVAMSGALGGGMTYGLARFLRATPPVSPKPTLAATGTGFERAALPAEPGFSRPEIVRSPVPYLTPKAETARLLRDQRQLAATEKWLSKPSVDRPVAAARIEEVLKPGGLGPAQELRSLEPSVTMRPELPAVAAPAAVGAELRSEEPLAAFFRVGPAGQMLPSRMDVTGGHYRQLQHLFKGYGVGEAPDPLELQKLGEGARIAGRALQREAREAGLPTKARAPQLKAEAPIPDWVKEQTGLAEAGAESPDVLARLKALAGKERGAIDPAILARLGLGATGALVGGVTDPLGDPLLSAIAGGTAGALAPSIPGMLKSLGAAPNAIRDIDLGSPEGIKATAQRVFETLPQIQRFNYLADFWGLPANALAGPYGSAVMGALEHGLSGDPRGWKALAELRDPTIFLKEFSQSFGEAAKLIGRAEGTALSAASGPVEQIMARPGMYMTAGDISARNALRRAGFSLDEAKRITLTSEPELAAPKKLANLTKGSPLLQTMLPFTRTPANIGEQAAQRFPLLGFLIQSMREHPDPMKQQVIQQLLSTGVAGAAGLAGANVDPETAKILRRYVTNLAGQYSIPAGMGFTAGQAFREGKPMVSKAVVRGIGQSLPLPTTEPLTDWWNFISGDAKMPRGAMPADLHDYLFPNQGKGLSNLKPLPSWL